eukprot:2955452-Prymnesium_polylepis.1
MAWGSRASLLAIGSSDGLQLLPETVLHRSMRGPWALVQLSAHVMQLEHEGGALATIDTPMRIAGADQHNGHV